MFNPSCVIDMWDDQQHNGPQKPLDPVYEPTTLPADYPLNLPTVVAPQPRYTLDRSYIPEYTSSISPATHEYQSRHKGHNAEYDHVPRNFPRDADRVRTRSRSPPKYNGRFDFVDYQTQFECLAEDQNWDYETCGRKLSLSLTDSARSILSTIDKPLRRDYHTLCRALVSLHTTPGGDGLKRTELHAATRADGQCPSAFGRELRKLAARAYPAEPLPEAVLIQLFIKGLRDVPMERHVNLQDPQTLEGAVKQACAYQAYSNAADP